jgi:hypothetical protein
MDSEYGYPRVLALASDRNGHLYVGGYFSKAGGKPSSCIALYGEWMNLLYLPLAIR